MVHDERCELRKKFPSTFCACAQRAYDADPMLDEDGAPIPLGRAYGTARPAL
jgi:hypothetical protein